MGNKRWLLRYGFASLTVLGAGLATVLIACSDDDSNKNTPTPTPDSGVPGSATPDATPDGAPTKDASVPAVLQIVNAATDFGPNDTSGGLRVCFGLGATADNIEVAGLPPLPDVSADPALPPAIPIGFGGTVAGTGLDLAPYVLQPFLMNAESLAAKGILKPGPGEPGKTCTEILAPTFDGGAGPLVEGVDYWKLPTIPANTFQRDKSYILVLTGCTNDTEIENKNKCGDGYAPDGGRGVGNLLVRIYDVDRATAIDSEKIGAQFIHASQPAKVYFSPQAVGFAPAFVGDAGASPFVTAEVPVYGKTDLTQIANVSPTTDSFSANPNVPALSVPLSLVQQVSFPAGVPDGGAYRNGAAFTFVAVGDPTEPPTVEEKFNSKTLHYLGFPNNPEIVIYKP